MQIAKTTTSSQPVLSADAPVAAAVERVHFVSLGCPKNRVDSEVMVGQLRAGAYALVDDPANADVIIVNTCSFIQPATEESIETVLELAKLKHTGTLKKLVVTGCMVQRYGAALESELPEVDVFLGTGEYHRITEVLQSRDAAAPRSYVDIPLYLADDAAPRVNSWSQCSAYLKISEGCNHTCTFCIIPQLRGKLRSRSIPSLVTEARRLADEGVVELNLVSQDSTAYGRDLKDGTGLGQLMKELADIPKIQWVRLHYAYPHGLPAGLLEQLATNAKVVKYLDIPLQHAAGPVLKAMRRGVTREGQARILERIRAAVPDIAIRTTFIVGFPGETDADFAELCDFVREQKFHHVGVFTYFQEDGTPAALLDGQVPEKVKKARQKELMKIQAQISRKRLKALVGQIWPVLIEGRAEESDALLRGRLPIQAPDVDGQAYIVNPPEDAKIGQIRPMKITRTADHDVVGEIVG